MVVPLAAATSVAALSHIGVWMSPGRTEFTRTLSAPYLRANALPMAIIAAFEAP